MLDHISLGVADFERSRRFYDAVLATLGSRRVYSFPDMAGYGQSEREPRFWIGTPIDPGRGPVRPSNGMHFCFAAPDRDAVRAFHRVALEWGGRDDGAPGLRTVYHPHYYAAFVIDLDGHKIEAVCHRPEPA
jgi:catechol 2,3-dioxygenase-like lactoylglutathione lyase family enzyme